MYSYAPTRRRYESMEGALSQYTWYYIFVYFRSDWIELIQATKLTRFWSRTRMCAVCSAGHGLGMFIIAFSPSQGEVTQNYTAEHCKAMIVAAIGKSHIPVEI